MNHPKYIGGVFLAALMYLGFPSATLAQSASDQLDNATNGQQTTGQTFDGGPTPTDAVPDRGADVPPVPEPQPVDDSGSEDSGSNATPSTDTAPDRSADVPSEPDQQPADNSAPQDSDSNATPSTDTAPDRSADVPPVPDQQPADNSAPQDSYSSATPSADAAQ